MESSDVVTLRVLSPGQVGPDVLLGRVQGGQHRVKLQLDVVTVEVLEHSQEGVRVHVGHHNLLGSFSEILNALKHCTGARQHKACQIITHEYPDRRCVPFIVR